jgi:hypothetical protein
MYRLSKKERVREREGIVSASADVGKESLDPNKTTEKKSDLFQLHIRMRQRRYYCMKIEEATFTKAAFIVVFKMLIKAYIRGCKRECRPLFQPSALDCE